MIARAPELVGRQSLVAQVRELTDVRRSDAVVPQLDQRRQRPEPVAERAHLAQIGGLHAVLTGANELRGLRLRVALLVQLVQERVPDVVPRQLVLLAAPSAGRSRASPAPRGNSDPA